MLDPPSAATLTYVAEVEIRSQACRSVSVTPPQGHHINIEQFCRVASIARRIWDLSDCDHQGLTSPEEGRRTYSKIYVYVVGYDSEVAEVNSFAYVSGEPQLSFAHGSNSICLVRRVSYTLICLSIVDIVAIGWYRRIGRPNGPSTSHGLREHAFPVLNVHSFMTVRHSQSI